MDYKQLINKAVAAGFSDFEAYVSDSETLNISLFNGNVDKTSANSSHSIALRGIYQEKVVNTTIEDDNADIDKVIKQMIANALVITSDEKSEIFAGSESYPTLEAIEGGFDKVTTAEKIELLKQTEQIAKGLDSRIVLLPHCQYTDSVQTVRIINSKGLDISKSANYGVLVLGAVAKDGDSVQDGFEVKVALKYSDFDPEKVAKTAVEKAISMLGADAIESKSYPVIMENDAMASVLGGFCSMFSGDAALKRLTSLIGKEGEKIMGEEVNIIDDPLMKDSVNSQPFDDEGVASYTKYVVEKGVFKTFLHNLKTAKFFNAKSTGNGVRGVDVGVGPVNLYVQPGMKTKEEIIKETEEGLLITDLAGLHAGLNPVSGDFSAQASGYYIKDGEIVKPVTLIVVSGNFLKMMNEIEEIGSDLYMGHSGIGAPSIKFKSLPISGK